MVYNNIVYGKVVVFARKMSASDHFIHGTDLFNAVIYRDFSVLYDLILYMKHKPRKERFYFIYIYFCFV